MPDYKTMYFDLAGKVANAIDILIKAQQEGEESYINNSNQPPITLDSNAHNTGE